MEQITRTGLTEFKDQLFDPVIDIADILDYTGRPMLITLPYLRKHQLLPFFPKGKWQLKISFMQLIWLRVIDTLRQFNYKVVDMQKLCDYFFNDAYLKNLPRLNMEYNIDQLKRKQLTGTISEGEATMLESLKNWVMDEKLQYGLKMDVSYLSNLVIQCIEDKEDTGLLVFSEGRVLEYDSGGYTNHNNEQINILEPHIHLSIKYFLQEFIDDDELSTLLMPRLLNKSEQKVLKALADKSIIELIIKKRENGKIRVDTVKAGMINGEKAKEIKRILGLANYEEIEMSTRDQQTLHFKKTQKNINSD